VVGDQRSKARLSNALGMIGWRVGYHHIEHVHDEIKFSIAMNDLLKSSNDAPAFAFRSRSATRFGGNLASPPVATVGI
jgi:hypothetical protein